MTDSAGYDDVRNPLCDSFVARGDLSPVASCEQPAGHDGNHYAHIALLNPSRDIVDVDMEW